MSLFDVVLYRSDEATVMSDITYLPSGLSAVKTVIRTLAKKKQDWNIDILENEKGRQVVFEDEVSIFVPHQYWNDFVVLLDGCCEEFRSKLGRYLKEN